MRRPAMVPLRALLSPASPSDRTTVEPRLDPSAHTLAAALERVRIACDRAARAANAEARRRGAPEEIRQIALRRAAYVRAATETAPTRAQPIRAGWVERSQDLARRIRRRLRGGESPRRTYLRQTRLTEAAIAACADVLAMRLSPTLRQALENEQTALELDRRVLSELARDAPPSAHRHESALSRTARLALGAVAATLWDLGARHHARRGVPPA